MFATEYGILEKSLQGNVLPAKHKPESPFSTEQRAWIVR